jgi:hypothetical protein
MAGLVFWHNLELLDSNEVMKCFYSLNYVTGKHLQMGDWNVAIFPKRDYNIKNWLVESDGAICGVGTFAYKGKFYDKALPSIYKDFKKSNFDKAALWGSFIIIVFIKGIFNVIRDGAGLTRLYQVTNKRIFSTSFAGLINCTKLNFTIDKDAATELLATGVLIGKSTLLNEITSIQIEQPISHFFLFESRSPLYHGPLNRKEAVEQQIAISKEFTKNVVDDWFNYSNKGIIDIGMTGGLDSRLLVSLFYFFTSRIVIHTHWRKEQMMNDDYKYAHIFANESGIPLYVKRIKMSYEMSRIELESNFHEGYCLSDGEIRPGVYWDEPYCTAKYRSEIVPQPFLRLFGFGGEQYRNGECFPYKYYRSLKSWIKWEMNYQFAGRYLKDEDAAKKLEKRIEDKLIQILRSKRLDIFSFKKYVRLIQSPSYRSLQAQMENRLGFCINPFLDIQLSSPSALAIPYLGRSLNFQLEMISKISKEFASIPNGYGFNFYKGEPVFRKLGALGWQGLPPWAKHPLYAKYRNFYRSDYIPYLSEKQEFIRNLENSVISLNLPIDFNKYRLVSTRSKLMLNLGFFLLKNQSKLKL